MQCGPSKGFYGSHNILHGNRASSSTRTHLATFLHREYVYHLRHHDAQHHGCTFHHLLLHLRLLFHHHHRITWTTTAGEADKGELTAMEGRRAAADQRSTDGASPRREDPGTAAHPHHHQGWQRRASRQLCKDPLVCTTAATSGIFYGLSFPRYPCTGRHITDVGQSLACNSRHVCCLESSSSYQDPHRADRSSER